MGRMEEMWGMEMGVGTEGWGAWGGAGDRERDGGMGTEGQSRGMGTGGMGSSGRL